LQAVSTQVVPPSSDDWKSTVAVGAVGLSEPGGSIDTVAVAVTGWPVTAGIGAIARLVLVAAWLIATSADAEVDGSKLVSPL